MKKQILNEIVQDAVGTFEGITEELVRFHLPIEELSNWQEWLEEALLVADTQGIRECNVCGWFLEIYEDGVCEDCYNYDYYDYNDDDED